MIKLDLARYGVVDCLRRCEVVGSMPGHLGFGEVFETLGDIDCHVQCLSLIELCRCDQGRCSGALEYFRKAVALIEDEERPDRPGHASAI